MLTGNRHFSARRGGPHRRAGAARILSLAVVLAAACFAAGAQESKPAAGGGDPFVGVWHASLPNGLRTATLSFVPHGEGLAGTFVGYDYDRRIDFNKPVEGDPPKIAMRSGGLLADFKPAGDRLTFKIHLRLPPAAGPMREIEIAAEMKVQQGGAGELTLTAPHKPEPLRLKLTRD